MNINLDGCKHSLGIPKALDLISLGFIFRSTACLHRYFLNFKNTWRVKQIQDHEIRETPVAN